MGAITLISSRLLADFSLGIIAKITGDIWSNWDNILQKEFSNYLFGVRELRTIHYTNFSMKIGGSMIKSQDCLILLKLLANPDKNWTQRCLAGELCISLSEINAGLKRLEEAGLIRKDNLSLLNSTQFLPILAAAEEFLITAIKYLFPAKLGSYTQGMPTAVAAPIFEGKIALGNDPIPVWPDVYGNKKGVASVAWVKRSETRVSAL